MHACNRHGSVSNPITRRDAFNKIENLFSPRNDSVSRLKRATRDADVLT